MTSLSSTLLFFAVLTVVLGGGAAFLTGRALASAWRPPTFAIFAAVPLAAAARFLHWALAAEPTDAVKALLTFGLMAAFAFAGFSIRRRAQMLVQYPWLASDTRRALQPKRDLT